MMDDTIPTTKGTKDLHPPQPVYLDYMASTPVGKEVMEAMNRAMQDIWGNPHSDHSHGCAAREVVEEARESLARLVGAESDEIVFTSGATEANNLAIKGVMHAEKRKGDHVIVSAIEHKCVLEAAHSLAASGTEITEIRPRRDGTISPADVAEAIRPDTALVSVMHANNETGVIQQVQNIAALCRENGVLFHTDAAQTVGKIGVDFADLGADFLSLSGHKFYGPKGIGALVVSNAIGLKPVPLIDGGGQQAARSGTLPVPLCAGIGEAARQYRTHGLNFQSRIKALQINFEERIGRSDGPFSINPHAERIPGCTSVRADGVSAEDILLYARNEFSASTGSACNSGSLEPSYVLLAQGLTFDEANASIRIGIGRNTSEADIERAVDALFRAFERARKAAA